MRSPSPGKGDYVVGIDGVGANVGEIVFYVTGSSARMTEVTKGKPSDATIIAIVDVIEKDGDAHLPEGRGRGWGARMTLARVRGTVVATKRADTIDGAKWLLVEECNQRGEGRGEYLVGLDMVGAERGHLVLLTQGSSCRWTRRTDDRPMDTLVVAIVDSIHRWRRRALQGRITGKGRKIWHSRTTYARSWSRCSKAMMCDAPGRGEGCWGGSGAGVRRSLGTGIFADIDSAVARGGGGPAASWRCFPRHPQADHRGHAGHGAGSKRITFPGRRRRDRPWKRAGQEGQEQPCRAKDPRRGRR